MTHANRTRVAVATAAGLVTVFGFLATTEANAARRNKGGVAKVRNVDTPWGLQGTRGAGNEVAVPFVLVDKRRRRTDVEVQYGWDVNKDGKISDGSDPALPSEYFPCTEDRRDPRNTRKNKNPQLYSSSGGIGSSQSYVWNSSADVGAGNYPTIQVLYTPQGRPVPDPNNPPDGVLFAPDQPGLMIRMRSKGKKGVVGAWTYTSEPFALNNNTPPSMTIDAVIPNDTSTPEASDENIEILWTAIDEDSEDTNGNGQLDPLDLEDADGDGELDAELVAVAFDYYVVQEGEDPSTWTDAELEALGALWRPCTRAAGLGDPDDGVPSAPTSETNPNGAGIQHTFVWNSAFDLGTVNEHVILRARPFDEKQELGAFVYFRTPFRVDNWKIFHTINRTTPTALPAGRTGLTVVNMTPGLLRSENYAGQMVFLAGGSDAENGNGSRYMAVLLLNTQQAPTTEGSLAATSQMLDARSYHTAVELDDGRIFLAGGYDAAGNELGTTEIYDPLTRTFEAGPTLLEPRAKHAACKLVSGDVALFGGVNDSGVLKTVELYTFTPYGDPVAPNQALPDMAVAQHSLHAVLLPDQRVLVTGGVSASGTAVKTAEALNMLHDDMVPELLVESVLVNDPRTKNPRFESLPDMLQERMYASATLLPNGHVLFAGGAASPSKNTLELFNWETGDFEQITATMPDTGRAQHIAALLGDGTVLLAGGTTDPASGGTVVGDADVFQLGTRSGNTWSGSFLPVNGDMWYPRRAAAAATIANGRVVIAGGIADTGAVLGEITTFTPENGANFRPAARTYLASSAQSWAYGAPVLYRLTDPEQDNCRIVMQWSDNGGATWNAAFPKVDTIGGDVADGTAGQSTGAVDDPDRTIDPAANPESDHTYIWFMARDIPRPPPGGKLEGFIFRAVPFGAVQGAATASTSVDVLYNTKVIPTVVALRDENGVLGAEQGGDISIWLHLRDIDGPGTSPRPGDLAKVQVRFGIDDNQDGVVDGSAEPWQPISQSGAGVDPDQRQNFELTNLPTYSEAYQDSDPDWGDRPTSKGWTEIKWDSVFDLGAPVTSWDNVQIQIRTFDNLGAAEPDEGFTFLLRNEPGQDPSIILVKDPGGLWLREMKAKGGSNDAVAVNEPIDLIFNGLVDGDSVSTDTIQITRNGSLIKGAFGVPVAGPLPGTSIVTFYPDLQNTVKDQPYYTETSNPTVLFALRDYEVFLPAYSAGDDALAGTMLRPDHGSGPVPTATSRLVQNSPNLETFTTGTDYYDDGSVATIVPALQEPPANDTLEGDDVFTLALSAAVDVSTVKGPHLTVTTNNGAGSSSAAAATSVVPGQWSVTNVRNPDGRTTSTLTFTSLIPLPAGATLEIDSTSGLKSASGRSATVLHTGYVVSPYGRKNVTDTETFGNANMEDTSVTDRASWGTDLCYPGVLTGFQDGSTPPSGSGGAKVVSQDETLSGTSYDWSSLTVEKGATLTFAANGPVTVRVKGDVNIYGTVDFSGADGWSGAHGSTSYTRYMYTTTKAGNRKGGKGYNGGYDGGDSRYATSSYSPIDGYSGSGPGGGQYGDASGYYYYGAGGGAGAGHAVRGLNGGKAAVYPTYISSYYGLISNGGSAYGSANFTSGPTAGSGGGGGGSGRYSSYHHEGGAGGAGGGALTFLTDGKFILAASGLINGRGGAGGASAHWGGSGGGGSGGGLEVKAGDDAVLDGVIDLRGGRGGPAGFGYYRDYYIYYYARVFGTARFGGDGAPGRFVCRAPNMQNRDEVRVFGQLIVEKVDSIPVPTNLTLTSPNPLFVSGGTPVNGSVPINFGTTSEVYYTNLTIPAGRTVNLVGQNPLKIYVQGTVDIQGRLLFNGLEPEEGYSDTYAPEWDSQTISSVTGSWPSKWDASAGTLGGGKGGNGNQTKGSTNRSQMYGRMGTDGGGPAGGKQNNETSNPGYDQYGYYNNYGWGYMYFTGDAGGGGGGGATDGDDGWAPYAHSPAYRYAGGANDGTGAGVSPSDRHDDGGAGGKRLDATGLNLGTLANFVGSGGGGGNAGGFTYYSSSTSGWHYAGVSGAAGSAAGALAIVGQATVQIGGEIQGRGGNGNPPGAAYNYTVYTNGNWNQYPHSGGGAASGGTIYIMGESVTLERVTVGEGSGANGATLDLRGGRGGGWRNTRNVGVLTQYPSYNTYGNFGGDGGFGIAKIAYKDDLNGGKTLFNRWGMEQSTVNSSNEFHALAGSAYAECRSAPAGGDAQSLWYDLASVVPVMNGIGPDTADDVSITNLQAEGAQSHPNDPGSGGKGTPDPTGPYGTSGWFGSGNAMLDGWRWMRFKITFKRKTTNPSDPQPVIDDMEWTYETDDL